MTQEHRYRTTQVKEIHLTIKACTDFLRRARYDVVYWKWALTALHQLTRGTMVVALTPENPMTGTEPPNSFRALFEDIRESGRIAFSDGTAFDATSAHERAIGELDKLVRDFTEFRRESMVLDLKKAPALMNRVLEVPFFLARQCGKLQTTSGFSGTRILDALKELKEELRQMEA